jgi:uncharacterized membrane protein YoaK (UPF0700 family)
MPSSSGGIRKKIVGGLLTVVAVAILANSVQTVVAPLIPVLVAVVGLVLVGSWLFGQQ